MNKLKLILYLIICSVIGFVAAGFLAYSKEKSVNSNISYISEGIYYRVGSTELFTGTVRDTAADKILEYKVVNGIKQGKYNYYFLNGRISLSGTMKDNKNNGEWNYYYENGQVECKGYFVNDAPSNKWIWFYKDGSIKEIGWYKNGFREGSWIYYDSDGKIFIQRSFKKNVIINEIMAERNIVS